MLNLQLHHVISGVTGLKIVRAIVAGERDPDVLAAMRDERCRESEKTIRAALVSNYQPEHVFALAQALDMYEVYQARIADCDNQIEKTLQMLCSDKPEPPAPLPKARHSTKQSNAPKFDVRSLLYQLTSMDLPQIHGIWFRRGADLDRRVRHRHEPMTDGKAFHLVADAIAWL